MQWDLNYSLALVHLILLEQEPVLFDFLFSLNDWFLKLISDTAIAIAIWFVIKLILNTSYLTDSYIIFTLKMESVSKNTIFGLKMMVKSGLEKIFLKFLHAGDYFHLLHKSAQNHKFSNKNNYLPAWRDFKINFLDHFLPSFLGQKRYFWIQIPFWG